MPPQVASTLAQAVAATRGGAWRETEQFHGALNAYVDALRSSGLDIVQTLLTVKGTLVPVPTSLLEQSVKWCIERYYGAC